MHLCIALFVTFVLATHGVNGTVHIPENQIGEPSFDDVEGLFAYFQIKYNRDYYNAEERARRFEYFQDHVQKINRLKRDNPLARFGLTEMADYSPDERLHHTGFIPQRVMGRSNRVLVSDPPSIRDGRHTVADVPVSIDWRDHGALNPVRDQMLCGSCWAFATIAVTESQWFLKHNVLLQLSEQMLVSCDPGASGCNGAVIPDAVNGIITTFAGNVTARSSYPYVSYLGYAPPCEMSFLSHSAVIKQLITIDTNESVMMNWVGLHGPIIVGVDASDLSYYHGGIITNATSVQQDHAVVIVGYGEQENTPYWIVRNSWSANWGEAGYFRVARGVGQMLINVSPFSISV